MPHGISRALKSIIRKLIWLHYCFIKAMKSVCLTWFISPDRLSNMLPHTLFSMVEYTFSLFLECSNSFYKKTTSQMLPSEVPLSHFPKENYSPLCSHKTQLHLSYSSITRYIFAHVRNQQSQWHVLSAI